MLNQLILVGRITSFEEQEDKTCVTVAIPRAFKNEDGIYEVDLIKVLLYKGISKNAKGYLRKGDVVGIKGSVKTENDSIICIAEKVTFLSSAKKTEEN